MMTFLEELQNDFEVKQNELLSSHTSWQVGGPAKYFVVANSKEDLIKLVKLAHQYSEKFVVIGRGANILASDTGFEGLVIKNKSNEISFGEDIEPIQFKKVSFRHGEKKVPTYKTLDFKEIDYDENDLPRRIVEVSSGEDLSVVFQKGLQNKLTGLQWFAGIPASVGGAVYNNIHGGEHFLSDLIYSVDFLDENDELKTFSNIEMQLDYDFSIFHKMNSVLLSVKFALYKGDVERAKNTYAEWAKKKMAQPRNSAGSTWQNLTEEQQSKGGLPIPSTAYLIDQVLHLKGLRFGKAFISVNGNANFIETESGATAEDVLNVMKETKRKAFENTGVELKSEIFFIGFDKNPLED